MELILYTYRHCLVLQHEPVVMRCKRILASTWNTMLLKSRSLRNGEKSGILIFRYATNCSLWNMGHYLKIVICPIMHVRCVKEIIALTGSIGKTPVANLTWLCCIKGTYKVLKSSYEMAYPPFRKMKKMCIIRDNCTQ